MEYHSREPTDNCTHCVHDHHRSEKGTITAKQYEVAAFHPHQGIHLCG